MNSSTEMNVSVKLLGQVAVARNSTSLDSVLSGKGIALLAYLMTTRGIHSRAFLSSLLWSDQPEAQAKKNLRNVLPDLRSYLGTYLTISRQAVEFNAEQAYTMDTEQFERVLSGDLSQVATHTLENALEQYRGEFMDGFHVRSARLYESWLRQQRAYYYRLAVEGWGHLADRYVAEAQFESAERAASQLLKLEPFNEAGHQMLMTALYQQGRQQAALLQYATCVEVLQAELGITVSPETLALHEKIKLAPPPKPRPPEPNNPSTTTTQLVGRKIELCHLQCTLEKAQRGAGQLVLVKGDRGSGKSSLLETFAADLEGVRVLRTRGSNIAPSNDAYRLFRNLLHTLGGRWPTEDVANFVLRRLIAITKKYTLVLVFDDLHWATNASWTLFYELLQQIRHLPVLMVAAYRVSWERSTQWGRVVGELMQQSNCTVLDLDKARRREGIKFVDTLIDSRPNDLPSHFRKRLFTLTQGHPLLTTEFLSDLERRGVIGTEDNGVLLLLKPTIWDDLPESMIGLLESWLQPLTAELRQILRIASVEGDEFTSFVVKAALPEREMHVLAQQLGQLDREYGIIDALEPLHFGRKTIIRYYFRYPLIRQYLYERTLTPLERATLPEVLGLALNELFSVAADG